MKKALSILTVMMLAASLAACGGAGSSSTAGSSAQSSTQGSSSGTQSATQADTPDPATDSAVNASETTEAFSLETADGSFTQEGNIYKITAAGTYTLSGLLEGQILVEAGEDDEVVLELAGTTINYDQDSPIKAVSAGSVDISAKKDTENVINRRG